jgi:predicted kinase
MKDLILLRGLPGAGKSTLAKIIGGAHIHIEADDYFIDEETGEYKFNQRDLPKAHNWCQVRTEYALEEGCGMIVVANTFTQEWEMKPYYELAAKYGYRVHSLIVENRHGNKSIHNVPELSMGNMLNRFNVKL